MRENDRDSLFHLDQWTILRSESASRAGTYRLGQDDGQVTLDVGPDRPVDDWHPTDAWTRLDLDPVARVLAGRLAQRAKEAQATQRYRDNLIAWGRFIFQHRDAPAAWPARVVVMGQVREEDGPTGFFYSGRRAPHRLDPLTEVDVSVDQAGRMYATPPDGHPGASAWRPQVRNVIVTEWSTERPRREGEGD